ncbi:hypothetical protein TNCT_450331 [Trichonephila clavata]|uniref:Uncharacterized protein n=1 Tax=Trichonephila clavata TaxID=2740835 RepID=A0A8X6KXB0_TRICU|nr:hypothetical protein TNCT_450331 [Trichonephila clavata]
MKAVRIRCHQELIDIETYDKEVTDSAQLKALIVEKAQEELDYAIKMGELKVLFPCPVKSCQVHKNGINSFRTSFNNTLVQQQTKRPAEPPILPAKLILDKKKYRKKCANAKH